MGSHFADRVLWQSASAFWTFWREIGEMMRFIFMDFTGEHYGLAASLVFTASGEAFL